MANSIGSNPKPFSNPIQNESGLKNTGKTKKPINIISSKLKATPSPQPKATPATNSMRQPSPKTSLNKVTFTAIYHSKRKENDIPFATKKKVENLQNLITNKKNKTIKITPKNVATQKEVTIDFSKERSDLKDMTLAFNQETLKTTITREFEGMVTINILEKDTKNPTTQLPQVILLREGANEPDKIEPNTLLISKNNGKLNVAMVDQNGSKSFVDLDKTSEDAQHHTKRLFHSKNPSSSNLEFMDWLEGAFITDIDSDEVNQLSNSEFQPISPYGTNYHLDDDARTNSASANEKTQSTNRNDPNSLRSEGSGRIALEGGLKEARKPESRASVTRTGEATSAPNDVVITPNQIIISDSGNSLRNRISESIEDEIVTSYSTEILQPEVNAPRTVADILNELRSKYEAPYHGAKLYKPPLGDTSSRHAYYVNWDKQYLFDLTNRSFQTEINSLVRQFDEWQPDVIHAHSFEVNDLKFTMPKGYSVTLYVPPGGSLSTEASIAIAGGDLELAEVLQLVNKGAKSWEKTTIREGEEMNQFVLSAVHDFVPVGGHQTKKDIERLSDFLLSLPKGNYKLAGCRDSCPLNHYENTVLPHLDESP